jgi:hypothetical protein
MEVGKHTFRLPLTIKKGSDNLGARSDKSEVHTMLFTVIITALASGTTATPATLGNCVSNEAIKLAPLPKSSKKLAPIAVGKCKSKFEQLVAARDTAAAKDGERPSNQPANSKAYRRSLNKLMTRLALTTIEQRRQTR